MRDKKEGGEKGIEGIEKKGEDEKYKRCKHEYKELCERRKREENIRWKRKAEKVRREGKMWEIVNRERWKRRTINKDIGWEEWKKHYMILLGGVKDRVIRGKGRDMRGGDEEEESREEVKRIIGKLKDGKAAGLDEIPNELWRYKGGRDGEGMD